MKLFERRVSIMGRVLGDDITGVDAQQNGVLVQQVAIVAKSLVTIFTQMEI